jgi:citrate lyase subunit beta/citryl-CoA lyase
MAFASSRIQPRSWLFVPAHQERMVAKASKRPADALLYDLEDSVPLAEKGPARAAVAEILKTTPQSSRQLRFVRVNALGTGPELEADLEAAVRPGLDGLLVPKVDTTDAVLQVASLVGALESARGMTSKTPLLVAIESPIGLLNAPDIATCSSRIIGLNLGAEDFGRELGLPLHREAEALDLLYVRSALAIVAAAYKVQAVDGVWTGLDDADGLVAEATQARRLGFTGKTAIHPSQLGPINDAFTPAPDEVAYAREVVEGYKEAVAEGSGALALHGQLLDPPVVERAQRVLDQTEELGLDE